MKIALIVIGIVLLLFFIIALYSILKVSSEQSRIEERLEAEYRKRQKEENNLDK